MHKNKSELGWRYDNSNDTWTPTLSVIPKVYVEKLGGEELYLLHHQFEDGLDRPIYDNPFDAMAAFEKVHWSFIDKIVHFKNLIEQGHTPASADELRKLTVHSAPESRRR